MKLKFFFSILIILLVLPVFPSGPIGGSGGGDFDNIPKPPNWYDAWPPKNWGQFRSWWNHNMSIPFPYDKGTFILPDGSPSLMMVGDTSAPQARTVKEVPSEKAKSDAVSAKAEEAAKCSNCFKLGFYPVPTAGLDYDRNRYIIYLGSDEVIGDEAISQQTGTMVGPFAVVEYGTFNASIGIKGVVGLGYIGGVAIGLNLKGGTGYESSRIATTYEEAKNMKRLKSIPRTVKELAQLPLGTVIVSKLTGGIAFEASVIAGYVANASSAFGAEGEWLVKVAKPNNYQAVVSIMDTKSKDITLSAGVALPAVSLKKGWSSQIFFSFQISLDNPEGMAAYNNFFKGKIISVQHAARRNSKLIKQLKKDQFDEEIYKPLIDAKAHAKTTIKNMSVGVPFIGAASRNFGSESYVEEELRYLTQQDLTALGSVEKGTMIHSFRGSYSTGKNTVGLASTHRERLKEFNVKVEDITFPSDNLTEIEIQNQSSPNRGFRRILSKFEYKFHKNNWTKKDWEEEVKFMARRTGFKDQLISQMRSPVGDKPVNFVEFQASLKISEAAIRTMIDKINRAGQKQFYDRLSKNAQFNLEKWFSDPQNQKYEQCDNLIACKKRISVHTDKSINEAVENLYKADRLFKILDKENSDRVKKELVKTLVSFGSGLVKNQFTVGTFVQELLTNRINDKENDFAYCFQWKGSNFRANEFVLIPSGLRPDKKLCYLKEETQIDEIAKKNDRDLFGSEFILD